MRRFPLATAAGNARRPRGLRPSARRGAGARQRAGANAFRAAFHAHAHRLTNLTFLQADWLAPFAADCADLILSNPPYIAANDPHLAALTHEPQSALIAAADGYRDLYTIMQQAPRNLKPNGWLLMEHGWQQGEKLRARATSSGDWHNIATHPDYAGRDRITEMQKRG